MKLQAGRLERQTANIQKSACFGLLLGNQRFVTYVVDKSGQHIAPVLHQPLVSAMVPAQFTLIVTVKRTVIGKVVFEQ